MTGAASIWRQLRSAFGLHADDFLTLTLKGPEKAKARLFTKEGKKRGASLSHADPHTLGVKVITGLGPGPVHVCRTKAPPSYSRVVARVPIWSRISRSCGQNTAEIMIFVSDVFYF